MASRRILVLQGHPDPDDRQFGHALAGRHADGARDAGHVLGFVGIGSVRRTWVGMVEGITDRRRARWLESLHQLGAQGA